MRRMLWVCVSLLCAASVGAQNNKMQMVTYFPVPYVAYNDVTVTQFCDVGLLNQCQMNVGPGSPADNPFSLNVRSDAANPANVLNTGKVLVEDGRLNLNSSGPASKVYSQDASHGIDAGVAGNVNSEILFNHQGNIGAMNAPRSTTGTAKTTVRAMQVYPAKISNEFPACPSGVTWKRLPLGYSGASSANEAYLVCGGNAGTGSCAGSKPAMSQACSGCGTQTRNVWCESGTWRTSGWTACPVKPNETVSCGNAAYECGGSATRTVSCSGGTWTASAWNYSGCWNKYGGGQTRSCSAGCGTETSTATCSGATWSGSCWSPYGGYGPYTCGSGCGTYGASSTCGGASEWSDCWDPSKPSCNCSSVGKCGTAKANSSCYGGSCDYSTCSACVYDCPAGSKPSATCNTCGTRSVTCDTSTGSWKTGSCSVASAASCTKECPAASKPSTSCGNCGTRSVTCNGTTGSWETGSCSGEGCKAGSTETASCDSGYDGNKTRTCNSSCQWGSWNTGSCVKGCSPQLVSVGIAYDYHFDCTDRGVPNPNCNYCGKASYNIGGSMPWVNEGVGCEWHNAYWYGGTMWNGGTHLGVNLPMCYGDHAAACKSNGCGYMCVVSQSSRPSSVGKYKCSNGYHCQMAQGSGTVMRCLK